MPRAKFFTFDSAALAVDEAFSAALADPAQREALVDEAIDSMHGLSQPWASRMTRLIRVLHGGPDYVDFVPTPKIRKKILALVSTIVPTVTVMLAYLKTRAERVKTDSKIEQVHEVVNSKHAEALAIIEALKIEIRRLNVAPGITTAANTAAPAVMLSVDGQVSASKEAMPVQVPPNPLGEAASPASALARIADLEGEIRRLREVASLTAKTTPSHDAGGDVPEVKLVPNQKIVVAASKK